MDNLERKLLDLPRHKLGLKADLKIRLQLYYLVFINSFNSFRQIFKIHNLFLFRGMAVAVVVFILLGGTSLYAYSNNQITVGSPLYPLKRTAETVKNNLSISDVVKTESYNKQSQRRLVEASIVSNQAQKSDEETDAQLSKIIDQAVESFNKSVVVADKIKDSDKSDAVSKTLKDDSHESLDLLDSISKNVENHDNQELSEKIERARVTIDEYVHEDELREGNGDDKVDQEETNDKQEETSQSERTNKERHEED